MIRRASIPGLPAAPGGLSGASAAGVFTRHGLAHGGRLMDGGVVGLTAEQRALAQVVCRKWVVRADVAAGGPHHGGGRGSAGLPGGGPAAAAAGGGGGVTAGRGGRGVGADGAEAGVGWQVREEMRRRHVQEPDLAWDWEWDSEIWARLLARVARRAWLPPWELVVAAPGAAGPLTRYAHRDHCR
jgi:hypothetical protein